MPQREGMWSAPCGWSWGDGEHRCLRRPQTPRLGLRLVQGVQNDGKSVTDSVTPFAVGFMPSPSDDGAQTRSARRLWPLYSVRSTCNVSRLFFRNAGDDGHWAASGRIPPENAKHHMGSGESSAVRFGHGFNTDSCLAQIMHVGGPSRRWLIDRRAAARPSLHKFTQGPCRTPFQARCTGLLVENLDRRESHFSWANPIRPRRLQRLAGDFVSGGSGGLV